MNSNQFLGFQQSGQSKLKSLPLMDRTRFLAVFLLLLLIADASNASLPSRHRYLIDDPPAKKGSSDNSTSQPGKDSPVTSPPPPSKPDSDPNPKPVDDQKHKPGSAPLDPNPDQNKSTKPAPVGQPIVAGDGKNNQTQKPTPEPEKKPKEKEKPTPEPEQKPKEKEKPTPEPEQKPKEKEKPTPEPEQKPKEKEKPTPEPEQKPKEEEKPKEGNVPGSASSPPPPKEGGGKEKTKNDDNVPNAKEESCDGISKTCSNADMVACVKSFDKVSTEAVILVQNVRDSILVGNVSAEDTRKLVISEHKNEEIKLNMGKSNKVVLKAGNGECVFQMDSFVSEGNYYMRFPSYDKLVTRINGAYLLIVTVIIFGGMWACCLFRRRKQRTGGGVPYQELEMALPESASANDVVTAEGWDEGWDDDWDGDNAVKSPGGHLVGSISANGLTARSSNKDGWENNWDD
ncbi:uncharacterized protein LOC126800248 [Argentina anserina]|uniref:uncharacterized protein LOC126800248 n=1 Tax=Argentina anserina TaxID=57926 RepID=UPI0021766AA6|nr:uncharacterized protein LOC126800248 [Potentilla anserina]